MSSVAWIAVGVNSIAVFALGAARLDWPAGFWSGRTEALVGITWTEGKWLIGRCWRTRKAQFADLQQELGPFESYDQAAWDALTHDTPYGLSFEEFQRLKSKYDPVAAAPIVDRDGGYLACVTADMPPVAHPLSLPPRHAGAEIAGDGSPTCGRGCPAVDCA
ncbi:MAG: hypothetical protein ACRD26_14125 [Vicinamibacterales bacterium]